MTVLSFFSLRSVCILAYEVLLGMLYISISFIMSINCSASLLFLVKRVTFSALILLLKAKLVYFLVIHIRVGFIWKLINMLNWLWIKRTVLFLIKLIIGGFGHHRTSVVPTGTTNRSLLHTSHHLWYIGIVFPLSH